MFSIYYRVVNSSGNGNSFEIKGIAGVKINKVKISTAGQLGNTNYAPTSAIITVDGAVVPTVYDSNDPTQATYLVALASEASSIKIQNGQTGSSAQIRIHSLEITYTQMNLWEADFNNNTSTFIKSAFIKDDEIIFEADVKDIKIFTLNGELVKIASVKEGYTLNVAGLKKGNYYVTGMINEQPVSQKILIE